MCIYTLIGAMASSRCFPTSNKNRLLNTIIPVKGSGLQKTYTERYRGTEQSMILQTRIMIICVVSDDNLETAIDVILENASENLVGDGKIFIYAVEDAIRIRTKTRGIEAIK